MGVPSALSYVLSERQLIAVSTTVPLGIGIVVLWVLRLLVWRCCRGSSSSRKSRVCGLVSGRVLDALIVLLFGMVMCTLSALSYASWQVAGSQILVFSVVYSMVASGFLAIAFQLCKKQRKTQASAAAWEELALAAAHVDGSTDDYEVDLIASRADSPSRPIRRKLCFQFAAMGIPLIVYVILAFFAAWAVSAVCIATYPNDLSNHLTRTMQADPCTEVSGACHVYATLSEDPTTSMIVTFHTIGFLHTPIVVYGPVSVENTPTNEGLKATPVEVLLAHPEGERFIYHTYLEGLAANSVVHFQVRDGDTKLSKEFKFRTFPNDMATNSSQTIKYISGGDFGMFDETWELVNASIATEPLFLAAGGDLAYDNACFACYRRWDAWLFSWEARMVTPGGFVVPLLTSIGNHESGGYHQAYSEVPFYTRYFAHERLGSNFTHQRTFHAHSIGTARIYVLDSDTVESARGEQSSWLETQLSLPSSTPGVHQWHFGLYHVPVYPVYPTDQISTDLEQAWRPIFDKYGLHIAFENHGHYYKRSKPLRDGGPAVAGTPGTVYLGDGCFGIPPTTLSEYNAEMFEKFAAERFYLQVTVKRDSVAVKAIGMDEKAFDDLSLSHTL